METGDSRPPDRIREDSASYRSDRSEKVPVQLLDDPDFIGAEVALKRAAARAIARAKAADLESVVAHPPDPENIQP